MLFYLPTQIRFLIRGKLVTCHWSNLHDDLGWTKLQNSLQKQELEFSTRTWWDRAPLKHRQLCMPVGLMSKIHQGRATFLTIEGIHYSTRKAIFNSAKTYQIKSGENLNVRCLEAFKDGAYLLLLMRTLSEHRTRHSLSACCGWHWNPTVNIFLKVA